MASLLKCARHIKAVRILSLFLFGESFYKHWERLEESHAESTFRFQPIKWSLQVSDKVELLLYRVK
jgi:hypothetical protein